MEKRNWLSKASLTKHGYCYYLVLLLVYVLHAPPVVHSERELTLAVFISGITNGTGQFTGNLDGRVFKAAVEMAVDIINQNSTDLLQGYQLNHAFNDSRVRITMISSLFTCHMRVYIHNINFMSYLCLVVC